jgi:hypothetical protein
MRNFISRHSLAAKATGIMAAAAATVLINAGIASATTSYIWTSDGDPGGIAFFDNSPQYLSAQDRQADGYAVWAQLWRQTSSGEHTDITTIQTVGSNDAGAYTSSFVPGTEIHYIVCLRKGTDPVTYCNSRTDTA